jgi:hypothetical protein
MARFVIAGVGAVGARAARQVHSLGRSHSSVEDLAIVGRDPKRVAEIVGAIGPPARASDWADALAGGPDAVILAGGTGHTARAEAALAAGAHVVSTAAATEEVEALLGLGGSGAGPSRHLVIGAAFAPGLSCVLAVHAGRNMDAVDEVRVASLGTGGPACAREHHQSLRGTALEWSGGGWARPAAGTGREECWFPDPGGGQDCYRADLGVPILLHPRFPQARRITVRRAATKRDRLSAPLPMLRPPHREGLVGAIRVEVVGRVGGAVVSKVLGSFDRPAVAAGAVAALAAHWAVEGRLARTGAAGLAEMVGDDTVTFLSQLAERGVKTAVFTGTGG